MGDKFVGFSRRELVYSRVNGHEIQATVLTPKTLEDRPHSPCPVLVFWHGGGFVTGHRVYGPWWPTWSLELALSQNALIISPDYRLLPEASGLDILADVVAFWDWMHDELPSIASRESWNAYPDLSRVVVFGQSAGGYLAVQSALLPSLKIDIKAVIALSAPLDGSTMMKGMVPGPRVIMGTRPPPPRQAEALIRDYIRGRGPNSVRSEGDPVEMWPLVLSLVQQGRMPRLLALRENPQLDPTKMLEKMETIPPLWIIHTEDDSVVPVGCSTEFAAAAKQKFPQLPLLLTIKASGDHIFSSSLAMDEPWVQEGCQFVVKFWQ